MKHILISLVLLFSLTSNTPKYVDQNKYSIYIKKDSIDREIYKQSLNDLESKFDYLDNRVDTKLNNCDTQWGTVFSVLIGLMGFFVATILAITIVSNNKNSKQRNKIQQYLTEIGDTNKYTNDKKAEIDNIKSNIQKDINDLKKFTEDKKNEIEKIEMTVTDIKRELINSYEGKKAEYAKLLDENQKKLITYLEEDVKRHKEQLSSLQSIHQAELEQWKTRANIERRNISIYNDACEDLEEGLVEKAKRSFENILKSDQEFFLAEAKLPMCYSALDQNETALHMADYVQNKLERLLSSDSHQYDDAYNECISSMGTILRRKGNFEKAIAVFEKNINIDNGNQKRKSTFSHIGYCHLYLSNFDEAIESFKKAISSDKTSPGYYGIVKSKLLKGDDFKIDLESAYKVSAKDLFMRPEYVYHVFGSVFLKACDSNVSKENFKDQFNIAMSKCRNLGILKEQLFEYNLFQKKQPNSKFEYAVEKISQRIDDINNIYKNYEAL